MSEILINQLFAGSYLQEGINIGHEIINLFRDDNDENYLFITPYGNVNGHDVDKVLFVQNIKARETMEVVMKAEGLSKTSLDEIQRIFYAGVNIVDIFNKNLYHGKKDLVETETMATYRAETIRFPKKGKRILLEKMTFIWKRFNFSQKVTARNIFRYKKRAIMTIIGIAGCTGLMLTGFGIKDSVVDIPNAQFKGIFKYDSAITLTNTNELENIEKYLNDNEDIEEYTKICASAGKLEKNNINCNTNVFISESLDNYENAYNLINYQTGEKIKLNSNGIVITDKAADMLGVTYGDYVTFIDGDDVRYEFKVENITKNHVGHYIYMTKDFYQENVKQYKTNMIYINTKDISIERQNDISRDILKFDGVASVTIIDTLMKTVSDMLNTMNYVVVILIVASALLAFVVLYSLANINIAERQREIATLKVLGFYDREVDNYINKENIIFTILGVIIGLVFGTFLTTGIILSIEIDSLRFMQNITILSYIYSAIITIAFSIIVNFIIHFVLKKINMIESLKSVE